MNRFFVSALIIQPCTKYLIEVNTLPLALSVLAASLKCFMCFRGERRRIGIIWENSFKQGSRWSKSPFILLMKSRSSDPTSSRSLFWQPPAERETNRQTNIIIPHRLKREDTCIIQTYYYRYLYYYYYYYYYLFVYRIKKEEYANCFTRRQRNKNSKIQ